MTSTRCERQGQIEIGIIEHEGRDLLHLVLRLLDDNLRVTQVRIDMEHR